MKEIASREEFFESVEEFNQTNKHSYSAEFLSLPIDEQNRHHRKVISEFKKLLTAMEDRKSRANIRD